MKSLLVLARPFRFATMSRVDVRLGSAADAAALGLGGFQWETAVVRRPRLSIDLLNETLDGRVQSGKGDLVVALEQIRAVTDIAELYWSGAPITIWDADGLDLESAPIEFTGIVREAQPDLDTGHLTLNLEVSKSKLERPLLGGQFDGSGGLGGEAGKRGLLKPTGFGSVRNVEPVWFDETRNIGMVDGYGNLLDVSWLGEGASDFGPSIGDFADYAALAAAHDASTIPPGRWATSIADGLVCLGAPPSGVITCDCMFGTDRPGALIERLLTFHAAIPPAEIDLVSLAALDVAVDRPVHYWTKDQRQVDDLVQAIAASCNATPLLTFQGQFAITRAFGGDQAGTLDRYASSRPRVTAWATAEPDAPAWRMTARADRPGRVLSYDEILYEDDLIDRGLYSADETYRQGHMVWLQDGSQWLFINPVASSGHAPPAPPATEDDYWERLKPPTTAADLYYADGTLMEDLKPAQAGATRNVHKGAWAAGQNYDVGDIVEYQGSSYSARVAHLSAAGNSPPSVEWALLARQGDDAPVLLVQWSVDGATGWHPNFTDGDQYLRTSSDNGLTWSDPAKVVGEGGQVGADGKTKQFVFRRSLTQPATPTGNGIPSGWSDGPPADNGQPLWMSVALQTSTGVLVTPWSAPVQLSAIPLQVQWSIDGATAWHASFVDGDQYIRTSSDGGATWSTPAKVVGEQGDVGPTGHFKQHVFKRSATQPAAPTGNGIPAGWSDGPPADNGQPLWMSVAEETAAGVLVTGWSAPVRVSAYLVLVQWSVDGVNSWHASYTLGDKYLRTSTDGGTTWSAAAKAVGEDGNGIPGNFSQYVFKRSAAQPAAPTGNGIPAGWSDAPPAPDGNKLWMAVAEETSAGVLVGSWSTPVQIEGSNGAGSFTLVAGANVSITPNSITKVSGATGWNAAAYSLEGYTGDVEVSAQINDTTKVFMLALNSDPTTDDSYASLDFAIYCYSATIGGTNTWNVYESEASLGPGPALSNGDIIRIRRRGSTIEYSVNGDAPFRITTGVNPNTKLYLDSSLLSVGAKIESITFKPVGADGNSVVAQGSVDGASWHLGLQPNDVYMRLSNNGGATFGAAVLIKGEAGLPGNHPQFVFRRSAAQPSAPTGNGIPAGWSDGVPADNGQPLWMSNAQQTSAGVLVTGWSVPVRIDGEDGLSVVAQGSADGTTWHAGLLAGDIYMRISNDGGVTFGPAVLVKGEGGSPGATGNVKQHVFKRNPTQPSTPSGNGIPAGWSDGPPAGTDPLWMSVSEQTAAGVLVVAWSTPVRITGDAGATAKALILGATSDTIRFDGNGNAVAGQTIRFDINGQNLAGTTCVVRCYRKNADGSETQLDAGAIVSSSGNSFTDNTPDANSYTQARDYVQLTGANFAAAIGAGIGLIVEVSADSFTTRRTAGITRDGTGAGSTRQGLALGAITSRALGVGQSVTGHAEAYVGSLSSNATYTVRLQARVVGGSFADYATGNESGSTGDVLAPQADGAFTNTLGYSANFEFTAVLTKTGPGSGAVDNARSFFTVS